MTFFESQSGLIKMDLNIFAYGILGHQNQLITGEEILFSRITKCH